jgi:ribonuclease D
MEIINNNIQLAKLVERLKHHKYIIIDTEFMRSNTYYPILCLIQIADDDSEFIIDCLSDDIDLSYMNDILFNPKITKIFHSCKQDIDVILTKFGKIPHPIFDTQIAANVCGIDPEISLANLSSRLLDISIDKSSRYSDWSQRPLSDDQLQYAVNDVIYLRQIYYKIIKLMNVEKTTAMNEVVRKLSQLHNYINLPEDAWVRLKKIRRPAILLPMIKKLSFWREINAQKHSIPRKHLLKDLALIEIAKTMPVSIKHLKKIHDIGDHIFEYDLAEDLLLMILDKE